MALIRVEWHKLLRTLASTADDHRTTCACGRPTSLDHLLRLCPLTKEHRDLLPAGTPIPDLLTRYEVSVLRFLVSANLVPGPVTLYVVPRASSAALPTVVVAAAVAAKIIAPAP
eukprot:Rhum_TRINITY_DN15293_c2_g3::Rhum_TRINITY_DN15293_c2_g3_i1::g.149051::m.149051